MSATRMAATLFGGSLVLRLAAVAFVGFDPVLAERAMAPDAHNAYLPLAYNLTHGSGYVLAEDPTAPLTLPPAFPAVLAALALVAGGEVPIGLLGVLNAVLKSLAVVLVLALGRALLPARAAVAAALLFAVDPWEAFWAPYVLKEALAVLLLLIAVRAWLAAEARPGRRSGFVAGLAAAVACLAWFGSVALVAWSVRRAVATSPLRRTLPAYAAAALLVFAPWAAFVAVAVPAAVWPRVPERVILKFAARPFDPKPLAGGYPPADRISAFRQPTATGSTVVPTPTLLRRLPTTLASRSVNLLRPVHERSTAFTWAAFGVPYLAFVALALAGLVIARYQRLPLAGLPGLAGALVALLILMGGGIRQRQYLTPLLALPAGLALARAVARDPAARDRV